MEIFVRGRAPRVKHLITIIIIDKFTFRFEPVDPMERTLM